MLVVPSWSMSQKSTTVIDSRGNLIRPASPILSNSGVVTLIVSPGMITPFDSLGFTSSDEVSILQTDVDIEAASSALVITSPGATYLGTAPNARGTAAAAASVVSDVTIVSGITIADLGSSSSLYTASLGGLADTRHGHTLTQLFVAGVILRSKLQFVEEEKETEKAALKPLLILAVHHVDKLNEEKLKSDLNVIFSTVVSELDTSFSTFEDIFDVKIIRVNTESDAQEVRCFHILWFSPQFLLSN